MYCPNCGTLSPEGVRFCKMCGANLARISDVISRAEPGKEGDPIVVIADDVKEVIKTGVEQMRTCLENVRSNLQEKKKWQKEAHKKKDECVKEPDRDRELLRRHRNLEKGLLSLFSGIGWMIVLYYLAPMIISIGPPFSRYPELVMMAWIIGLLPVMTGLAHLITAIFSIFLLSTVSSAPADGLQSRSPLTDERGALPEERSEPTRPFSVTEDTTAALPDYVPPKTEAARDTK